jgi:hypothetical protein
MGTTNCPEIEEEEVPVSYVTRENDSDTVEGAVTSRQASKAEKARLSGHFTLYKTLTRSGL